jgi:hypothetical protein
MVACDSVNEIASISEKSRELKIITNKSHI